MKKALKVTFGTMLAVSSVTTASAAEDFMRHMAVFGVVTYTQPSNNALSVGDLLIAQGNAPLDGGRRHTFIEPENEWDYGLGLTYRVPGSHTRVFFSYDHFDMNHEEGNINIRNIGFQPPVSTAGYARVDANSHEFRVGAIHDLHFGDRFCLDLSAFLEYDKIRQTLYETQENQAVGFPVNSRETENKLRAFGPGLGATTRWYIMNPATHVFFGMNTSLVYGVNNFRQFTQTPDPLVFALYEPQDSKSLVQKLDVNFGVNYHCQFSRDLNGAAFDIALGMRYMNIINAFKNGNTAYNVDVQANAVVANQAANLGGATDWGRWGPFLKFKLGGAHS